MGIKRRFILEKAVDSENGFCVGGWRGAGVMLIEIGLKRILLRFKACFGVGWCVDIAGGEIVCYRRNFWVWENVGFTLREGWEGRAPRERRAVCWLASTLNAPYSPTAALLWQRWRLAQKILKSAERKLRVA